MARPRLSVVIPTRGRAHTLASTLQTCIAQEFVDCEFLVSDNSGGAAVRETVGRFDDSRLRYVRAPKLLALTDSWEFAVGQAAGEYVTVIGDDDGLLLHALLEIDRILRLLRAPLLRWESVCYTWPDLPPNPHAVPNELLVPLTQVDAYHPLHRIGARSMILAAAHSRISYAQLPMIYCSAVHHSFLARLRARTGRVFRSQCPDVYSAFAFAYLAGSYHSCTAPMGLSGLSGSSNGVAELYLGGRSPVTEEFRRLNAEAGHTPHPRVPELPLMAAKVADSFERAKEALFADAVDLSLNRKAVVLACLEALRGCDAAARGAARTAIRRAIQDDPVLRAWFETTWHSAVPGDPPNPGLRRYGGKYLHLDAADFGVTDVFGAAVLCEKLLGYKADGLNVHLAPLSKGGPEESPVTWPAPTSKPRPAVRKETFRAQELHEQEADLALLLRLFDRLAVRTFVDVGAGRGTFVEAFLEVGCKRIYAIEPYPPHTRHLQARFSGDDRVQVLDVALGSRDETGELHIAGDPAGLGYPSYRSLVALADTPEIRPVEVIPVTCRSLGSLVEEGVLPAEVGILKVDTEGYDLEVVRGMGGLSAAVVMVEYWDSLPTMVGACPYSLEAMGAELAARGYSHVLVVKRHDGFEILQEDTLSTRPGDRGNAMFVHDRAYPQLVPLLREAVVEAQTHFLDAARDLRHHAQRRLETIQGLHREAQHRPDIFVSSRWHRLLRPRLGYLRHYPPRPLEIPARYRAEPPVHEAPLISIVTATLNTDRFLDRTIRSVLDQGYGPLEYIIQDGGSTDGTPGILDLYRERLAGIESAKDDGQADALNRGFARTTGEIMAYLNGDDLLMPGALRYVGRFFATHPNVDVVYGHRILIDENDEEIGRWVLPRHSATVLSWADYVPQETLFWRRGLWERAGGQLDNSFQFAMDWELLLRFRTAGTRFVRLPRFLGAFRVHEDQKTSRMAELGAEEMARLRLREHGRPVPQAEVRRRVRGYLLRHIAYQKLHRIGLLNY